MLTIAAAMDAGYALAQRAVADELSSDDATPLSAVSQRNCHHNESCTDCMEVVMLLCAQWYVVEGSWAKQTQCSGSLRSSTDCAGGHSPADPCCMLGKGISHRMRAMHYSPRLDVLLRVQLAVRHGLADGSIDAASCFDFKWLGTQLLSLAVKRMTGTPGGETS